MSVELGELEEARRKVIDDYKHRDITGANAVDTVKELDRLDELIIKENRRCKKRRK